MLPEVKGRIADTKTKNADASIWNPGESTRFNRIVGYHDVVEVATSFFTTRLRNVCTSECRLAMKLANLNWRMNGKVKRAE